MCFNHKQIISWPFHLQAFLMVVYIFVPYIWHSLGGIGEGFSVFCLVPMIFPWDSYQVPQVLKLFLKTFPITSIARQIYPIWFCPLVNSHGYKLKRWAIRELICFYFATGSKDVVLLGSAQWQNYEHFQTLFLKFEHLVSHNFGIS